MTVRPFARVALVGAGALALLGPLTATATVAARSYDKAGPVAPSGGAARRSPAFRAAEGRVQESLSTAVAVVVRKSVTRASSKVPICPHWTRVTVLPSRPTENRLMSVAPHSVTVWTP